MQHVTELDLARMHARIDWRHRHLVVFKLENSFLHASYIVSSKNFFRKKVGKYSRSILDRV